MYGSINAHIVDFPCPAHQTVTNPFTVCMDVGRRNNNTIDLVNLIPTWIQLYKEVEQWFFLVSHIVATTAYWKVIHVISFTHCYSNKRPQSCETNWDLNYIFMNVTTIIFTRPLTSVVKLYRKSCCRCTVILSEFPLYSLSTPIESHISRMCHC